MRLGRPAGSHRRRLLDYTKRNAARQPQPDSVQRHFTRSGPNRVWAADPAQHGTGEGWLYIATVLALSLLDMAAWNRQPGRGMIHHSDHGSQYTSVAFTKRLEAVGLKGSMGTVGDALDNATAESLFATLQTGLLDRRRWATRQEQAIAVFDYDESFYSRTRQHSSPRATEP